MSIDKDPAVALVFGNALPKPGDNYEAALQKIQSGVEAKAKKEGSAAPSQPAFSNARGDWYEILLAAELWNESLRRKDVLCVLLPNKASLPFHKIYGGESAKALDKLFAVLGESGVTLLASNPDFLIIRPDKAILNALPGPVARLDIKSIEQLRDAYNKLRGKCSYDMIVAGLGIKTSNRPDRRQQLVQEECVLKAIAAHFQTRFWDPNYRVRYVAATLEAGDADIEALKTAATHTIVSVNMPVEPAVDALIGVIKPSDVTKIFDAVLKKRRS